MRIFNNAERMVVLQDDRAEPLAMAGLAVGVAGFVLGAVILNWDAALLRAESPGSNNVLFGNSTMVVYQIVGFFHFGGVIAGLLMLVMAALSTLLSSDSAHTLRKVTLGVLVPVTFVVVFLVWTFRVLRVDRQWTLDSKRVDGAWLAWLVAHTGLYVAAGVMVARDVLK